MLVGTSEGLFLGRGGVEPRELSFCSKGIVKRNLHWEWNLSAKPIYFLLWRSTLYNSNFVIVTSASVLVLHLQLNSAMYEQIIQRTRRVESAAFAWLSSTCSLSTERGNQVHSHQRNASRVQPHCAYRSRMTVHQWLTAGSVNGLPFEFETRKSADQQHSKPIDVSKGILEPSKIISRAHFDCNCAYDIAI